MLEDSNSADLCRDVTRPQYSDQDSFCMSRSCEPEGGCLTQSSDIRCNGISTHTGHLHTRIKLEILVHHVILQPCGLGRLAAGPPSHRPHIKHGEGITSHIFNCYSRTIHSVLCDSKIHMSQCEFSKIEPQHRFKIRQAFGTDVFPKQSEMRTYAKPEIVREAYGASFPTFVSSRLKR